MYDAGGWVLIESAIADLPADLRWLYESGAVTIAQIATLHRELGATSAIDLADAVRRRVSRRFPASTRASHKRSLTLCRRCVRRCLVYRSGAPWQLPLRFWRG